MDYVYSDEEQWTSRTEHWLSFKQQKDFQNIEAKRRSRHTRFIIDQPFYSCNEASISQACWVIGLRKKPLDSFPSIERRRVLWLDRAGDWSYLSVLHRKIFAAYQWNVSKRGNWNLCGTWAKTFEFVDARRDEIDSTWRFREEPTEVACQHPSIEESCRRKTSESVHCIHGVNPSEIPSVPNRTASRNELTQPGWRRCSLRVNASCNNEKQNHQGTSRTPSVIWTNQRTSADFSSVGSMM